MILGSKDSLDLKKFLKFLKEILKNVVYYEILFPNLMIVFAFN